MPCGLTPSPNQKCFALLLPLLELVPPTSALWEMSNQFTQCTCLYQASTHFPRVMTAWWAAVICVCVNSPMVTVPSRDHTVAQVCPPCPPPALGSAKNSGRCQEAMEGERFPHASVAVVSSVSQPFYTSSKSEHSSEFLRPPLQAKAGNDSALADETREQGKRSPRPPAYVFVGLLFFPEKLLEKVSWVWKGGVTIQNYFKWKDFILAQTECVMILLSSVQWMHNLSTVLSKSSFSWFLVSKNLEL